MRDLQTLNAIEDIRTLEALYARYADHKRWDDLAALFTADGWFKVAGVDGEVNLEMNSPAEIAGVLTELNAGDVQPLHQIFTHEIDIESPTEARAVWAMSDLIFRGDTAIAEPQQGDALPPFRVMRGWGHYHVTYRKTAGHWQISTRKLTRTRLEFSS